MIEDNKLIEYFLELHSQIKVFHWAAIEYNKHSALDDLYSTMGKLIDKIVETYIAQYKKQPLKVFKITMNAHSDVSMLNKFLEVEREVIRKLQSKFKNMSEFQSIIDDMLIAFNQCIYLCNLK
jgi:DNA-binding ferritin-like protein